MFVPIEDPGQRLRKYLTYHGHRLCEMYRLYGTNDSSEMSHNSSILRINIILRCCLFRKPLGGKNAFKKISYTLNIKKAHLELIEHHLNYFFDPFLLVHELDVTL